MKEEVLEIIKDFKNRPNKDLVKALDLLNQDFEYTKNTMVTLSTHLDKLEYTYNLILKEYNTRNNVSK
jgi:5-enolpyruvylshikimate-3-phosphate synthase